MTFFRVSFFPFVASYLCLKLFFYVNGTLHIICPNATTFPINLVQQNWYIETGGILKH